MKKNSIELTQEQRQMLEQWLSRGTAPARQIRHAQILLKADTSEWGPKWPDQQIQEAFGVSKSTIWRVRCHFAEQGLDEALKRRPQPERPSKRKLDGEKEAHLIALTCGEKTGRRGALELTVAGQQTG